MLVSVLIPLDKIAAEFFAAMVVPRDLSPGLLVVTAADDVERSKFSTNSAPDGAWPTPPADREGLGGAGGA